MAALREAAASKDGIAGTPPDELVLAGKDNRLGVYGYDPASGRLGAGTDWVTVPKDFRDWLRKRMAATPTAPEADGLTPPSGAKT